MKVDTAQELSRLPGMSLLFHQSKEVVIRWMIKVAQLFREEEIDASAAHVMEAVRLAETLATLRRRKIPGMEELEESALTVFGQGDKNRFGSCSGQIGHRSKSGDSTARDSRHSFTKRPGEVYLFG